jgi:hypothetical protein
MAQPLGGQCSEGYNTQIFIFNIKRKTWRSRDAPGKQTLFRSSPQTP